MAILNHGSTLRTADGGQTTTTIVTAANIGTYGVATNSTYYVGTTQNVFNRASGAQTLTGVSIDGNAANITAYTINQNVGTANAPSFAGATLTSTLSITGGDGLRAFRAGAATITSHIYWANTTNTVAYNWQLDENNNAAMWGYTSAWGKLLTVTSAGAFSASGDVRAPIFYDSNDTAYYVDPNSVSRLSSLRVYSAFDTASSDVYANMRVINDTAFTDGMYIGFANAGSGLTRLFGGGATTGALIKYSDHTAESNSFRAPIFYDSDNTAYYLDAANSTTSLLVAGKVGIGNTSPSAKLHVSGASYTTASAANNNVRFEGGGGNGLGFGTIDATSTYASWIQSGYVPNFATATYALLLNPLGGNVGIGTTTPSQKLDVSGAINASTYVYAGVFYDNDNTVYYTNPSGTSNLVGLTVANTITGSISGSSASCTGNAATATTSALLTSSDVRTISPSSANASRLTYGFTSYSNNNTGSWADYLHLRSYADGTGGNDNLVMFNKNAIGMRIWQQAFGSATAYATYKDVAFTDQGFYIGTTSVAINRSSASQTLTGVSIDGNAATATNGLTTSNYVSYSAFTGAISSGGAITATSYIYTSTYLQTGGNLIYPSTYGVTQRLEVSNAANNAWIDGLTIAPGGIVTAYGDSRAPIFYDSANTAYYCDPNGVSNLYGVAIRGDVASANTDNQIFFWGTGNSTTSAIGFKSNSGVFPNPTGNGDGYNTYLTMDTDGRGWVFRRGVGGTDFTSAYTAGWILNNGIWQANASMRAPIFYDSNDTAYYGDFASTSVLNKLNYQQLRRNFASTVYTGTTGSRTVKTFSGVLVGGSAIAGNSAYTVIETTIPQGAYQMGGFTIKWFENYSSTNAKTSIEIAGYWNPVSNGGFIGFEYTTSNPNVQPTIRVGANASGNTVFILDHFSSAYTVIIARDLWLGYDNTDGEWGTGWTMVNTTTIAAYSNIVSAVLRVGPTLTGTGASGSWGISVTGSSASCTGNAATATNGLTTSNYVSYSAFTASLTSTVDARAPIFYDSNDTTYYIDPNSLSNIRHTIFHVGSNVVGATGVGVLFDGNYTSGQYRHRFRKYDDGGGLPLYIDYASATANSFTAIARFGGGGSYNPFSVYGTADASGDFRAPIFYDSNNTAYYIDGASGSKLKYLQIDGDWGSSPFGSGHESFTIRSTYASMVQRQTNGSLGYWLHHIASDGVYHLYGGRGATDGSSWDWAYRAYPNQDGNYVEFNTSARAQIFYDRNDTAYYLDPRSASVLSGLKLNGIDNDAAGNTSDAILWINKPNNNDWGIRVTGNLEYLLKLEGATSHTYNIQGMANGSEFWRCGTDLLYHNSNIRAPIFYDSDNTAYYLNPNSTTSLRTVGSWRSDSSTWDGEFSGKIQYHSNHWYFQSGDLWIFRNSGGTNVATINQSGVISAAFSGSLTGNVTGTAINIAGNGAGYDTYGTIGVTEPAGASNYSYYGLTRQSNIGAGFGLTGTTGALGLGANAFWFGGATSTAAGVMSTAYIAFNGSNLVAVGTADATQFRDSNDTAYFLDPAGTSNLNQWTTATAVRIGRSKFWTNRAAYNSTTGYHTGTNGWETSEGTWANAWKGGFSGWDIWGSNTDHPQGAGYIHAQGIVSGIHYSTDTGSNAYGWMMVGATNATDNRYWLRGKWDTSISGWVEMLTSGNYNSFSPTLTGTGASGNWAINATNITAYTINQSVGTGNSPTFSVVDATQFRDSNNTAYYIDPTSTSYLYVLSVASAATAADYYTAGWFRSSTSGNGMYNQVTGQHFYSDDVSYWNVASSSSAQGIRLRTGGHAGTVRGYFYADTANDVGLLNQAGNWRVRVVGGDYVLFDGSSVRAQIFYDSNNTAYYIDAASTSVLNRINLNTAATAYMQWRSAGQGTMGGGFPFYNNVSYGSINIEVSDNDTGGLVIDNEGVTVYGAGDNGEVFRVIDEDVYQATSNLIASRTFWVNQLQNGGGGILGPFSISGTATASSFTGAGTGLTGTAASLTIGGNAANVTGTVAIANGGTGATTLAAAKANLGITTAETSLTQSLSGTTGCTIDVAAASVHILTLSSGAVISSFTYNNRKASPSVDTLLVVLKFAGTATITWSNVVWASGVTPTLTGVNGKADAYMLTSYKGGAATPVWIGTVVSQNLDSTNL